MISATLRAIFSHVIVLILSGQSNLVQLCGISNGLRPIGSGYGAPVVLPYCGYVVMPTLAFLLRGLNY